MRTTKSVVVARTDEMKIPSGRENKRETMSKLPIDETILAMWQRHNSLMGVYQRITRLSKQASSLHVGKSHYPLDVYIFWAVAIWEMARQSPSHAVRAKALGQPIDKRSMEEARCGAACPGPFRAPAHV